MQRFLLNEMAQLQSKENRGNERRSMFDGQRETGFVREKFIETGGPSIPAPRGSLNLRTEEPQGYYGDFPPHRHRAHHQVPTRSVNPVEKRI